ncbi:MAG: enoyl-CoA hydratase/isomerase family protein, partial [Pseudomonadota bacterium]
MTEILQRWDDGNVTTLTLDDDARLNALSDAMLARLSEELANIAASDARVVILAAKGRAFCAGHDLREMQAMRQAEDGGEQAFADLFDRCSDVMRAIRQLPQPVIAQVHGMAT